MTKKCCEKCLNNKYALKDSEICGLPCDCHWNEEKKERRRCSVCQEWFETDKDYISCPAHSFGETTTSEEPLLHPNKMEWELDIEAMFTVGNMKFAGLANNQITPENLRDFIRNLLTSQLTELEEDIEKMKYPKESSLDELGRVKSPTEVSEIIEHRGYNYGLSDVQTLLSKKKQ